jgi:hypothetical protein
MIVDPSISRVPSVELATIFGMTCNVLFIFMMVIVAKAGHKNWFMSPMLFVHYYKLAKAKESSVEKFIYLAVLFLFAITAFATLGAMTNF